MSTKLHAVTDEAGRRNRFFMTAGQVSDYTGAAAMLSSLPAAEWLLAPSHGLRANRCRAADRGYAADRFRNTLKDKGIKPRIPCRRSRTKPVKYDKRRYKRRNRLLAHVNMRRQVAH
jgi:transposase